MNDNVTPTLERVEVLLTRAAEIAKDAEAACTAMLARLNERHNRSEVAR